MIHKHLLDALNAHEEGHDAIRANAHEQAQHRGHRHAREEGDATTTAPLVTPDDNEGTE